MNVHLIASAETLSGENSMRRQTMMGFLMVTMEPPPTLEEEFNDWYDTEHVPERVAIDGFVSATRMVCVSGWPRYIALYDLRSAGVLGEPAYIQVSGKQHSPWSKRILRKVRGLWRAIGDQVYPGEAPFSSAPRMAMIRYSDVSSDSEGRIVEAARRSFEGQPGVTQVRVMRCTGERDFDYLTLVEGPGPFVLGG